MTPSPLLVELVFLFSCAITIFLILRRPYLRFRTLQRMPWPIVPFILSLFVTVAALRHYGITSGVGRLAAEIFGRGRNKLEGVRFRLLRCLPAGEPRNDIFSPHL